MRRIIFSLFILLPVLSFAKNDSTLLIPFNKTVHVFFPSKISYFDVGSQEVLIDSANNMLKLKAGVEHFEKTNLTVITANNEVYHFILNYNENPSTFIYRFNLNEKTTESVSVTKSKVAETKNTSSTNVYHKNSLVAESKAKFTDMGIIDKKAQFLLKDIFIKNNFLYFVLEIKNESNIVYDIELIRFVSKNKKVLNSKKYAIQESAFEPVYILNDTINDIGPKFTLTKVFVVKKFTIAEDKRLFFELWEKGGDRQLNFSVDYKKILKAKIL
jgi:conjugative transposon TraN protein